MTSCTCLPAFITRSVYNLAGYRPSSAGRNARPFAFESVKSSSDAATGNTSLFLCCSALQQQWNICKNFKRAHPRDRRERLRRFITKMDVFWVVATFQKYLLFPSPRTIIAGKLEAAKTSDSLVNITRRYSAEDSRLRTRRGENLRS